MITKLFLLQVLLSFVVGGLYLGIMARLSEHLGSKLGGLLIALPSIALIGLIFIGITQDSTAVVEAATIMPATLAASSIFLMSFILLYRFGWLAAYFGAISIWGLLNLPLVIFEVQHLGWTILVGGILITISMSYFRRKPHSKITAPAISRGAFLFRVAFAGSFVAIAVLLAELIGPAWGGMFASFPAAFSATVLLFVRVHGIDFTASLSRSMVNGNLGNIVFAASAAILVPVLDSVYGLLAGYVICLAFAVFSFRYILPKL